MSPEYIRPYVQVQKNDDRDAEAIAEAASRCVSLKSKKQLDIQILHRARERLVADRTALINQLRATLLERGIIMSNAKKLETRLAVLMDADIAFVRKAFDNGLCELDNEIGYQVRGSPALPRRRSAQVGARYRIAELPELGTLDRRQIAAPVASRCRFGNPAGGAAEASSAAGPAFAGYCSWGRW